ncbi:MAG: protein translocase SEC61 complex subunit gamma [Nanoarchaeota archaeon]|nr:protein translocase SEC61 complex subunit gamma [Nanoarchaeota archaeon]
MLYKINSFFRKYLRVWHVLSKPPLQEFKITSKISVIGILLLGLLGFLISLFMAIFK